jgi:RHS repeat-associated protein
MSRIGSISDSTGGLASYDYLGAGTVASVSYPQPGLSLDYSADNFAAWDQFGEVLNQAWNEGSTEVDGYSYTYDPSGNRLTRANATDAALSESYGYDDLSRLTSVARGNVGTQTQTEGWTLDSLGNFVQSSENGTSQSRTTDASNEIQTITQGGTANTQGYDLAGNMTTIADPNNPNGTLTCTFDAWNRLTEVQDSSGNIIAQYEYDGTGRLVEELSNFSGSTPGTVTYSFYDGQNAIETRTGTVSGGVVPTATSLSPQYQYVFSPVSGKTPILRDSTFVGGVATSSGRLYYTSDANTNVTALVNASGQVVERYIYSAYGQVTFCDASWTPLTTGGNNSTTTPGVSSAVGNTTLYASMVLDPRTGLFYDEHRWYDASVSTFVSQDPLGFGGGDCNLYRYCGNDPVILVDPTGLRPIYFKFDAFIGSNVGGEYLPGGRWLPEPSGLDFYLKTDDRAAGQPGTSRLHSEGWIESYDIGHLKSLTLGPTKYYVETACDPSP